MKFTVRARLIIAFGLLIGIVIALGLYASVMLQKLDRITSEITGDWLPAIQDVEEINGLIADFRVREYRHVISAADQDKMETDMVANQKKITEHLDSYEKTIEEQQDRDLFNKLKADWQNYLKVNEKVIALSRAGQKDEALQVIYGESLTLYNAAREASQQLVKYNQHHVKRISNETNNLFQKSTSLLTVAIIIAALLAATAAYFISRSITKPLKEIEAAANRLAGGDFSVDDLVVKNSDEIGSLADSFNTMKKNFQTVLQQLAVTAQQLSRVAGELAGQAQQTAAGATETASTMNEIASTVEQVSANVQDISHVSETTSQHADAGSQDLQNVTRQIQTITRVTQETSAVIHELNEKSRAISQITDVITGIAEQTNLLALNAAIEAARAGEQGRGFAVVAEEVRKLAEQSALAAKDIANLINAIQAETRKAVDRMEEGSQEVVAGSVVIQEVGQKFQQIINSVQSLSAQIQDVAAAAEQMTAGVQNVAASTEQQTAAMEEVSGSAATLNKLAEELQGLVVQFKI
ncbi:methyl-accepting chemotaxis protein [Desulforamulus hydrothermalis]|uniref:Methyl-accepting chemotaxis sensory transducer n=1 Tax=Desulforamulus hydrothermalis Lam5 = DSM 18033 TaxID=1121428 RepID=K8E0X9_9FIRM|nr:HAMP domain-containing methyl-accepting chemotaxis protein [Desulforamulus hydrothermalis]CCO09317.1 Methyl-accepting chemotaxis sensory transducer [Desulforamulus hydrothermalis Lam5 = DSM 18033]SHH04273.1 methyl-accepting chemotaxis protein [Desulforamulus hydrothermalis Lam5 = DSM 18033]